jgi:UDP:flavonoid glycosyltransferase YjiC (YdhE family)
MKVLFSTWAWPSHYFPMVPLAQACRAAGHEVRIASQPALAAAIHSSGLPAVTVGRDVDVAGLFRENVAPLIRSGAGGQRPRRTSLAIGIFVQVAETMADDLVEFTLRWRPDIVVFDPITFAAPVAAAVAGVPAVRHLFGPDFTSGAAGPGTAPEMPGLAALLARFGLPDLQLRGALTVDPCPPSMQAPAAIARELMSYVPYNGPGTMPRWPAGPARRICLTWGTSTVALTGDDTFLPAEVITAAQHCGAEVVVAVTASQRGLLGAVPPGVRVTESVPLHLLLPACAAVVHQGGAGTTLTAAVLGLPQLILPQLPDQRFNAQRAVATGAARCLPRAEVTAGSASGHIEALLADPDQAAAALRLQQEIKAQPRPAEVVGALEELAGR